MANALAKIAHQLGRGSASWRAAATFARDMRRCMGTVGTCFAKWTKSPIKRRAGDSGKYRPIACDIHALRSFDGIPGLTSWHFRLEMQRQFSLAGASAQAADRAGCRWTLKLKFSAKFF